MSEHLVHALSGAGGGIISMALTYPLISVSTRQQVNKTKDHQTQFDTLRTILKEEGVRGLYSGLKSALVGNAVTQAVYYYFYELIKAGFESRYAANQSISMAENMLTGGIAGCITSVATNPIWVINTRLMTKDGESVGMRQAATSIYQNDGMVGFFRGLFPALILVCNPIIQFTVFEKFKLLIEKRRGELTRLDFFLLGAFSKLCATGITYPYM
jgi:adenine nucleotide transporter 17